ncbi:phage stabilization protein [Providencia alcalifaciens 205/92]|uniref:Phage stabilization protein n=2 Tax=Providencia alcalifaciens TaxID=126385 RepID=A0AAV3LZE3_9GAMM|nr:phage stabilization protein [Providencia alcalifaciens 205/92]
MSKGGSMPQVKIPLARGLRKDPHTADYIDGLPVNMLATPKEVLNAAGYLRSFPALVKLRDADGVSRGVQFNTKNSAVYRVCGGKLYQGANAIGDIQGKDRVSLAHSGVSQAVAFGGKLKLYRYDGEVKELTNWAEEEVVKEGYTRDVKKWTHKAGNDDFVSLTKDDIDGSLTLKITPKSADGTTGEAIEIPEYQFGAKISQDKPDPIKPYLTDIIVEGLKRTGNKLTITYKMNGSSTDATEFVMTQEVLEVVNKYPQYDLGEVIDVTRNRGRYIWLQKGGARFGITDIEDESKPDRYNPFYTAESQPDGIISVSSWRDMVICFGASTIEYFSLTGSTSVTQQIYAMQPAYMVQIGIAGRDAKCKFGDSYAFISNPANGAPSVYLLGSGSASAISTASIDKIIRSYTADELSGAVMESVKFDGHELAVIHLQRHTLCFDGTGSQQYPQWCILKTGLYDDPYRAIDFMYEDNQITVGDKKSGLVGKLAFDKSSQYDQQAEHILYTPMVKADNARIFDLELEASTGVAQIADRLFLSATTDGINFGREQMIDQNAPFRYDMRAIWRRVGRVRKNIGFKIRVITKSPVTLSDLSVRVE